MGVYVRDYRRSNRKKTETNPGQVDDDASRRSKGNKVKKEKSLQQIFDDNTTGRYSTDKMD